MDWKVAGSQAVNILDLKKRHGKKTWTSQSQEGEISKSAIRTGERAPDASQMRLCSCLERQRGPILQT